MRVLGVDFGSKRIGIAVGESDHQIATARSPLKASGALATDAALIVSLARSEGAEAIVVGVPVNRADSSDRMEKICLRLAECIRELGLPVHIVNEALSSVEAGANLAGSTKPGRLRERVDSESARLILERYFGAT